MVLTTCRLLVFQPPPSAHTGTFIQWGRDLRRAVPSPKRGIFRILRPHMRLSSTRMTPSGHQQPRPFYSQADTGRQAGIVLCSVQVVPKYGDGRTVPGLNTSRLEYDRQMGVFAGHRVHPVQAGVGESGTVAVFPYPPWGTNPSEQTHSPAIVFLNGLSRLSLVKTETLAQYASRRSMGGSWDGVVNAIPCFIRRRHKWPLQTRFRDLLFCVERAFCVRLFAPFHC